MGEPSLLYFVSVEIYLLDHYFNVSSLGFFGRYPLEILVGIILGNEHKLNYFVFGHLPF